MRPVTFILFRALMFMSALVLACVGAIAIPAYALFMVVWLHAPALSVYLSTLPIAMLMLLLSWGAVRLGIKCKR